jgi:hypothetical protein
MFPDNQDYEFKTEEDLDEYIRNAFSGSDQSEGYNFRSGKNITVSSITLFRFANKVMGWGKVSQKAVNSTDIDPVSNHFEGFVKFSPKREKAFESPLFIRELESITGMTFHFKDDYSIGRAYYKFQFHFITSIRAVVEEGYRNEQ